MAKRYYVDIPDRVADEPCDPMYNLADFDTREEAVKYCMEKLGTDENGNLNLISEVEDDEEDNGPEN